MPRPVVDFLDVKAAERFETRNALIRHLIVAYFHHAQAPVK